LYSQKTSDLKKSASNLTVFPWLSTERDASSFEQWHTEIFMRQCSRSLWVAVSNLRLF
jgi:hypothetical protein